MAEVLQDTYLTVWRATGSFAGAAVNGTAIGWLWTVAARRLVDAFRREGRHRSTVEAATAEPGEIPGAEEVLLGSSLSGDVGDALTALAPELRQSCRRWCWTVCRSGRPRRC